MEAMTMGERRRIIKLYERGWPMHRIAEAIGRSRSGVRRVRQRLRERGQLEPLKRGNGPKPKVTQADRQKLAARVAAQPDATIDELLERSGLDVSRSTIDRHVRSMKLSYKKSDSHGRTAPARCGATASAMEAQTIWAEPEEVDLH